MGDPRTYPVDLDTGPSGGTCKILSDFVLRTKPPHARVELVHVVGVGSAPRPHPNFANPNQLEVDLEDHQVSQEGIQAVPLSRAGHVVQGLGVLPQVKIGLHLSIHCFIFSLVLLLGILRGILWIQLRV